MDRWFLISIKLYNIEDYDRHDYDYDYDIK